jgi:hypothetical protein
MKGKPMSLRGLGSSSKTELLLFLVSRYDADPVARSDASLSRFIDEAIEGGGFNVRLSPRLFHRVLQQLSASEQGAESGGQRFPRSTDR